MTIRLLPNGNIEVPKQKQEEDIFMTIAHWSLGCGAAGKSGMYETVRELIEAENEIPGVLAGLVDPERPEGGGFDGRIGSLPHAWANSQATIHVSSYFMTGYSTMQRPRVQLIHGLPEASLEAEKESGSFTAVLGALKNLDASIVMNRRQHNFWKEFDEGNKLHYVDKGIDLTRFTPKGTRVDLDGDPAVGVGEIQRTGGVKLPFMPYWAMSHYVKHNEKARLHQWGVGDERKILEVVMHKSNFDRFLGKYGMMGWQIYTENWYRGLDMLLSPSMYGDPSRVHFEAMACGCPVIDFDSAVRWQDSHANMHAKALDPVDMAECIAKMYDQVRANKAKVRAETRAIAEKYYDIRNMAKQIVAVLTKVQDEVGAR